MDLIIAIAMVSQSLQIPDGLLSAVCFTESSHRVTVIRHNDGGSKSIGVCQIKLTTAQLVGYAGDEKSLLNPTVNVYYAGKYLKKQLGRYRGDIPKAVAAYNAGKFKEGDYGQPINQNYVDKVFAAWAERR